MTIKRIRKANKGYTLIEIIVVIAIIGILATIGFFSYRQIETSTRDSERYTDIVILSGALEKYYDHNGEYPDCSVLSGSDPTTVTSTTLKGLDPNILTAPSAEPNTNSITCISPITNTYAYLGGGVNFTLEYKEESSGKIISVDSKRQGTGDTYTVTLTAGTGGTVSKTGTSPYSKGATPTISATANSYYDFSSWTGSTGCSGTASHPVTVTTNIACVANFTPSVVNPPTSPAVAASTTGGTTTWSWDAVTCSGNTARYQYKYTISPSGYDSGWVATSSTSIPFTTSGELLTYTVTVQAQCYNTVTSSVWSGSGSDSYYRPITYVLTLAAGTGGTVSGSGSYDASSTATMTASASTYYSFDSWTGDTGCSGLASHTITMTSNKTCTANFVPTTITAPSAPVVTASTPGTTTTWSWPAISCGSNTARYQYKYTISPSGYDSGWTATASSSVAFTTSTEDQTYTVNVQAQCYNIVATSVWGASGSADYYRPIPQCTLTLIAGANGTVSGGGTYDCGITPATQTITATPNTYYSFSSWTGDTGCSGLVSHNITTDTNKTCTANFVPTTITAPSAPVVTASTPGTTTTWSWPAISCGSNTARYQYKYTISPSGYDSGWTGPQAGTSVGFTTTTEGQTYTVEIQAQCYNTATSSNWSTSGSDSYLRPITYKTLTLIAGSNGTVSGGGSFATSSTPTMTATPNTNYSFTSWTGDTGCSGIASHTIAMDTDKTCTANFTLSTYTLTLIAGTGGTVSGGGTYNAGTTQTITATASTYYAFSSWTGSTGCSGTASHTITMDAAKSCTANFTPISIIPDPPTAPTVGVSTPDSHSTFSWNATTCTGNTARYQYRYTINSSTPYDSGWIATASTSFVATTSTEGLTYSLGVQTQCYNTATSTSWSSSGSNGYLRPITYQTLTVAADTGGTVSGGGTYATLSNPTITATADTGYSFSSWTTNTGNDCSGASSHSLTITTTTSCTAHFTINSYYLTVNGGSGSGWYNYGSTATITASVPTGYTFSSWTTNYGNDCSGASSHSLTITTTTTCTANVPINTYLLTVNTSAGQLCDAPTPSSPTRYNYGTVVTISYSCWDVMRWDSWTGSTGCSGAQTHTITMDSDKTCTTNATRLWYYALGSPTFSEIYVSDLGNYKYKTSDTANSSPQGTTNTDPGYPSFNSLVNNLSVDFSAYPAQNACKSVGGRLPFYSEAAENIYFFQASYGNNFDTSAGLRTAAQNSANANQAYNINMANGNQAASAKTNANPTRCVR